MKEKEVSFPVLLDSKSFSREMLHIVGTPTTFVIDEEGRIRCRLVGYVKNLEELTEAVLRKV